MEGNIHYWNPLLSIISEDITLDTTLCVCVCVCVCLFVFVFVFVCVSVFVFVCVRVRVRVCSNELRSVVTHFVRKFNITDNESRIRLNHVKICSSVPCHYTNCVWFVTYYVHICLPILKSPETVTTNESLQTDIHKHFKGKKNRTNQCYSNPTESSTKLSVDWCKQEQEIEAQLYVFTVYKVTNGIRTETSGMLSYVSLYTIDEITERNTTVLGNWSLYCKLCGKYNSSLMWSSYKIITKVTQGSCQVLLVTWIYRTI
jgi:hypothetical protein